MLVASGYIDELRSPRTKGAPSITTTDVCITKTDAVPDLDRFWKLEVIGIQEQPKAVDDEKH